MFVLCVYFFLKGHRKSLWEPGESCLKSMSLVLHCTVSMFRNKNNLDIIRCLNDLACCMLHVHLMAEEAADGNSLKLGNYT